MMTISSSDLGHILTTHLLSPRRKEGDGPLVRREIYFKPNNSKATLPTETAHPPALMVDAKVDVFDFEPKEDDLMNDYMAMDDGSAEVVPTPMPKLKSSIIGGTSRLSDGGPDKTKGRGFRKENDIEHNSLFATRDFKSLISYGGPLPQRCIISFYV
jgi:hypothetical protein